MTPCPHVTDRRTLRWLPGSMEPDTTRRCCPLCDMPWGPPKLRCTAMLATPRLPAPDAGRCRLPVYVYGLCRIHWVVSRWAA